MSSNLEAAVTIGGMLCILYNAVCYFIYYDDDNE